MTASIITIIASIVLEGVKLFSEERRLRFSHEHFRILNKLESLKARPADRWSDSELAVANKELEIFLIAYGKEISNEVNRV